MIKTNIPLKLKIISQFGTQVDFALKLKKSSATVSEIINGRRVITEKDAKQWAKLLKCPIDALGLVVGK